MNNINSFQEYQKLAVRTAVKYDPYKNELFDSIVINSQLFEIEHCAAGLCTEAGEFNDQLKRHKFYGKPLDTVNLQEELGDTLWYIGTICERLGWDMSVIAAMNIEKLKARFPEKFDQLKVLNRDLPAERKALKSISPATIQEALLNAASNNVLDKVAEALNVSTDVLQTGRVYTCGALKDGCESDCEQCLCFGGSEGTLVDNPEDFKYPLKPGTYNISTYDDVKKFKSATVVE